MPEKSKRIRAFAPKVKSGCSNCKTLHKKCDEQKPKCSLCRRRGLACVYQAHQPHDQAHGQPEEHTGFLSAAARRAEGPIHQPQYFVFRGAESNYFSIFRQSRLRFHVRRLDGFVDRVVPRECIHDEGIRYGALAIGALTRAIHLNDAWPAASLLAQPTARRLQICADYRAAVYYYTKALRALHERLAKAWSDGQARSLVLATFLFVMFELIQHNYQSADRLLADGVSGIRQLLTCSQATATARLRRTTAALLDDDDTQVAECCLIRMAAISSFCAPFDQNRGARNFCIIAREGMARSLEQDHSTPQTLFQAWDSFSAHACAWASRAYRLDPEYFEAELPELKQDQKRLREQTLMWRNIVQKARENAPDPVSRATLDYLHFSNEVIRVLAACVLDRSEVAWELHAKEIFSFLMSLRPVVETIHSSQVGLAVDNQLFPILIALSVLCRDKEVRYLVLDVCRKWPGLSEDIEAQIQVKAREKTVIKEELARDENGVIPLNQRYKWVRCSWNEERTEFRVLLARLNQSIQMPGDQDDLVVTVSVDEV